VNLAELKTWAIAGAARFEAVWAAFDDFWKRSNTFHSFLRFVDAAEQQWGKDDKDLQPMRELRSKMIEKNGPYYHLILNDEEKRRGIWADDYGWCGIACLEAQQYLRSIYKVPDADAYLNRAEKCFQYMKETGYDATNNATPVKHGCGNTSLERWDKTPPTNYGTRNTVTNVNLLLLSLRLYAATKTLYPATKTKDYLQMAFDQYAWFRAWMTLPPYPSEDDGRYVRQVQFGNHPETDPSYALVHDRPMAQETYVEKSNSWWQRGLVWSGDQGLLMAALAEVFLMQDDFRQLDHDFKSEFVMQKCNYLAAGIQHFLFSKVDGVLREAPFEALFHPPGNETNYANDYVGGRGVLLRYASEASVLKARKEPFNLENVRYTAEAVWGSRDARNQFAPLWNSEGDEAFNATFVKDWGNGSSKALKWYLDDPKLKPADYEGVLQANGLDAFTAAIRSWALVAG
jgi:hypothetical protein